MTLSGVGTDIIEISRIKKALEKHGQRLLDRLFTKNEQHYCLQFKDPAPHFATRFAAKEALVKAMGTGFTQNISWTDFEIFNDTLGKPDVLLSPSLRHSFPKQAFLLSMSHCREYATAFVVCYMKD